VAVFGLTGTASVPLADDTDVACFLLSLQCFDAVGWAAGRASGVLKLSGEVLA